MEKKLLSEIRRQLELMNFFDKSVVVENYIFEQFPEPTRTPQEKTPSKSPQKDSKKPTGNKNPYDIDLEPAAYYDWEYKNRQQKNFDILDPGVAPRYDYDPQGGLGSTLRSSGFVTTGNRKTDYVKERGGMGCTGIVDKITTEVEGGWFPFKVKFNPDKFKKFEIIWNWGTDEDGVTQAILAISNKKMYDCVFEKLSKKYKELPFTQSLLLWLQQQEFSIASHINIHRGSKEADEHRESFIDILGPGAWYSEYYNDKYLRRMEAHLQKFNKNERFEIEKFDTEPLIPNDPTGLSSALRLYLPPLSREALHMGLAGLSLIISAGGSWPAVWASFGLEALDASIYLLVDKDPYSAGLAMVFAFAGPLDELLSPVVKKYASRILKKIVEKTSLDGVESAIVQYISRNIDRLTILSKLGLASYMLKPLKFIMSTYKVVKVIIFVAKTIGGKFAKFLSKPLVMITGSFFTWDAIASAFGLCNTMPLAPLSKGDSMILKLIGAAGPYLQPFTDPCTQQEALESLKKYEDEIKNTNLQIISVLDEMINKGIFFSKEIYSENYMYEVVYLQFVLTHFGFDYLYIKTKKSIKNEPKKLTKQQCDALFIGGINTSAWAKHPECFDYSSKPDKSLPSNKEIKAQIYKDPKPLDFEESTAYGRKAFDWGFYDDQTYENVKNFQKKYGLSSDGVAGVKTFKKMKSLVEGLGDTIIKKYVEVKLSNEFKEEMLDKIEKDIEEQKNNKITPSEIINKVEEQKDSIKNDFMKRLESLPEYDDTSLENFDKKLYEINLFIQNNT